ncbi:uncharacterized protein LOC100214568 isoform X2 [Hydra vulgaris]|uniref:uncharacterized protein LOC100214568 isoform X2 n=1 Tax=Hydra vulgaris TaxID=6087 RepID=UPI001F5F2676|nr:uncharacterized protein LOC100214568 isoform X2 [Hydra vulgaris]
MCCVFCVIGCFLFWSVDAQYETSEWFESILKNLNDVTSHKTPLKVLLFSQLFNKFNSTEDLKLIKIIETSDNLPYNQYSSTAVDKKVHHAKLGEGYMKNLVVINNFNFDGNSKIAVFISTVWKYIGNETFTQENVTNLSKSGSLLDITLNLKWKKLSEELTKEINKDRLWYLNEHMCYYQGSITKLVGNKCTIPYTEIIEYYYNLWQTVNMSPQFFNGNRIRVTNDENLKNNPPCFDNKVYGNPSFSKVVNDIETYNLINKSFPFRIPTCKVFENVTFISDDDVFLPKSSEWYMLDGQSAATGWSVATTIGNTSKPNEFIFNFTVLFNNWTIDFPRGLLDAYRDDSFIHAECSLEVYYMSEDTSLGIRAIVFRFATGTGRAFSSEVWSYYNKIKKLKKNESTSEEIIERMKTSAMEEAGLRQLHNLTGK